MSKDRVKAELDEFKTYRTSVLGVIIAILGWIATNYKTTENIIIICGIGVVIVLTIVFIALIVAIREQIKKL